MKKITNFILVVVLTLMYACGASQKAEKSVESGNYDQAFDIAFTQLQKDKSDDQKIILTFKDAYDKANARDLQQISAYKTQNNPDNLKKIYALYEKIDARQYQVISLQPLSYKGQPVNFDTKDYSSELAAAKKEYSKYLYDTASVKLKGSKTDAREANKLFNELEYINPTYVSNLSNLISQSKEKGSSFVYLKLDNKIAQAVTKENTDELLRISEANMSNPWVIYHNTKEKNRSYDYEVGILLNQFVVTPQQVNTETVPQQARVKDGWEYVLDAKGNVMKDSLGNDKKRDKYITVQAEVKLFQQLKSGKIDGNVNIKNLKTNAVIANTPVFGEAKFENVYGLYRGDQRAIEQKYYEALQKKEVPFPADLEFAKYALDDFKAKMQQLIDQQPF